MTETLTHTLTGCDAAAAKVLDEVQDIFHSKNNKLKRTEDWRLEFYIMQAMCSDMCSSWEVEKKKVVAIVNAAHDDYAANFTPNQIDTAFRRLTRRGFLYGRTRNVVQFEPSRGKARYYGVALDRYDTEEVAA